MLGMSHSCYYPILPFYSPPFLFGKAMFILHHCIMGAPVAFILQNLTDKKFTLCFWIRPLSNAGAVEIMWKEIKYIFLVR